MENRIGGYGDEAGSYHRLRDGTGVTYEIAGPGDESRLNDSGYAQELHHGLSEGQYHRLRVSAGFTNEVAGTGTGTGDDSKLNELGYKQELHRGLSLLANFSVTFSIISVITGITTLFSTGLTFGGPVSMIYGWPIAGLFSLLVGLSMSEICSAYPTAGSLYFWSAKLCGNKWGPFASWLTGWFCPYDIAFA